MPIPAHQRTPAGRLLTAALLVLAFAQSTLAAPRATAASGDDQIVIRTLSNRADLISDGDALVEVELPGGAALTDLVVEVDGRDVTDVFTARADGRAVGLVTGLPVGTSTVTARLADGLGGALVVTNHPASGPIFSGPQVTPWPCATDANGLGAPQDEACNAGIRYDFFYRSVESGAFEPYDPAAPPAQGDIAQTTTDEGRTVQFIIRRERGVLDRTIYDVAVLFDPAAPWAPQTAPDAWNRKLFWVFSGGCRPYHGQTTPATDIPVLDANALGRGFAVAGAGAHALDKNCNTVVGAEIMMMIKERIIEQYGQLRYTMAFGLSGGSIQQLEIADTYPGLLDGLFVGGTFADVLTTANEILDCSLLIRYFTVASPHLGWTPVQHAAVSGHVAFSTCLEWVSVFGYGGMLADPTMGCRTKPQAETPLTGPVPSGDEPDWVYDPVANPDGTRCTIWDYMPGIYERGPDGRTPWTFDNAGVQYGLEALRDGLITPAQFSDLNAQIGGFTLDYEWQPDRSQAPTATIERAYSSGRVTSGSNLDLIPILDEASPFPGGEAHTTVHAWSLRERLDAANGHHDNHVIRQDPVGHARGVDRGSFDILDEWLTRIEADTAPGTQEEKVVRNKPADATDTGGYVGTSPRIAAGAPLADDILKCTPKQIDPGDYGAAALLFLERDWSLLRDTFPDGVCSWNLPSIGHRELVTWATYAAGAGPQALPPAPMSTPVVG